LIVASGLVLFIFVAMVVVMAVNCRLTRTRPLTVEVETIHSLDTSFYEEVNEVVQEEPVEASDPETL
jgi:hypothetical protein